MRSLKFHQGFPLDCNLIKGMLQCIARGEATSEETVGAYIGVNPYKVEGLRGWLCKLGLGSATSKKYTLSDFGSTVAKHDPDFARLGTLWLLHYFLASEHAERSEVWYRCFNEFLSPGKEFTRKELQEYIECSLPKSPANKTGVEKDSKELVKTYIQATALGDLGLITKQTDTRLVAGLNTSPDPLIVAYVLFDMWQRRYEHTNTLRLSQLVTEPETPGRIFVATVTQVREWVLQLQAQQFLTFSDTQHEPVTRLFADTPMTLLKQYYQNL